MSSSQNINPNNPAPISYPTSAQINTELQLFFQNPPCQLISNFPTEIVAEIFSYYSEYTIQDRIDSRQITIVDPLEALKSVTTEALKEQKLKGDFGPQTFRMIVIFESYFLKFNQEKWLLDCFETLLIGQKGILSSYGDFYAGCYEAMLTQAFKDRDFEVMNAAVSFELYPDRSRIFKSRIEEINLSLLFFTLSKHGIEKDLELIRELIKEHPKRKYLWYREIFKNCGVKSRVYEKLLQSCGK